MIDKPHCEPSPINRWNDILLLLERLAPEKRLVPDDMADRIRVMGIGHEICGELGFGWNRRLDMLRPQDGGEVSEFATKYGYREADAARANGRVVALMTHLAETLKAVAEGGADASTPAPSPSTSPRRCRRLALMGR